MAYYVYRYMIGDQWIYVGKSKNNLAQRIAGHRMEDKFQPYKDIAKIQYCELSTKEDMDITEMVLIKAVHPVLNTNSASLSGVPFVVDENFKWKDYSRKEVVGAQQRQKHMDSVVWDHQFDIDVFLDKLKNDPKCHMYYGPIFQEYKVPISDVYHEFSVDQLIQPSVIYKVLQGYARERSKKGDIEVCVSIDYSSKSFYFNVFVA